MCFGVILGVILGGGEGREEERREMKLEHHQTSFAAQIFCEIAALIQDVYSKSKPNSLFPLPNLLVVCIISISATITQMRVLALLVVTATLNAPFAQAEGGTHHFARDKKDYEKTCGRRITASPGESVIATIQLKAANSREFANDEFPIEPLSLSVVNRAAQYSFNFLVRDSEQALLGMGDWNGHVVDWVGQDIKPTRQLSASTLQGQLRYEGLELPVVYVLDHNSFGRTTETFKKRFRGKHEHSHPRDTLRNRERNSIEMVSASDTECYKTIAWLNGFGIPERQRERQKVWNDNLDRLELDYFTHEDLDGCVKRAVDDKFGRPRACLPIQQYYELFALWGGGARSRRFLLQEHERQDAGFTKRAPGSDILGMLAKNFFEDFATDDWNPYSGFNSPQGEDICTSDKEIDEAVKYWNRQLRKNLPSCTLMFDSAAEPPRLSGFCHKMSGGRVSVEFDLEPESPFWDEGGRQAPGGDHYHEGSYHYYNSQYNSYESSQESGGGVMRRICYLVLFGLCSLTVMAWPERKRRVQREE